MLLDRRQRVYSKYLFLARIQARGGTRHSTVKELLQYLIKSRRSSFSQKTRGSSFSDNEITKQISSARIW